MSRLGLKASLLLLSVVLTLFVVEVSLFFVGVSRPRKNPPQIFEYDQLLGWRKKPHFSGTWQMGEYTISEQINSHGNRGPECSYAKDHDVYRILVLGDSFAEGIGVEFEQIFSEILKRKLNAQSRQGRCYDIINTGTSGYGTDQELLYFQTEGKKYDPDLTILMFCYNDVWYNNKPMNYHLGEPKLQKPLFVLEHDELRLTNVPVPYTKAAMFNETVVEATTSTSLKDWLSRNSQVYSLVRDSVKSNYWLHKQAVRLGIATIPRELLEEGQALPMPRDLGCWKKQYTPEIQQSWEVTEALLVRLQDEVNRIGSKLIVFNIPSQASIYEVSLRAYRRQFCIPEDWQPERVGRELDRICARNKIEYILATPRFKKEAEAYEKTGELLYYPKDRHWTALGHRLAAEILADYIGDFDELAKCNVGAF